MLSRLSKFLLLACFAYWATGAALYLHERLEHGEGGEHDEVSLHAPSPAPALTETTTSPIPAEGESEKHHNDHDKCPVCQMLALMKVDRAHVPVLLESYRPYVRTAVPSHHQPVVVFATPFAPIRGPPAHSSTCA